MNSNQKYIFDSLIKEGYKVGDEATFEKNISTTDGANWAYTELSGLGYNLGDMNSYLQNVTTSLPYRQGTKSKPIQTHDAVTGMDSFTDTVGMKPFSKEETDQMLSGSVPGMSYIGDMKINHLGSDVAMNKAFGGNFEDTSIKDGDGVKSVNDKLPRMNIPTSKFSDDFTPLEKSGFLGSYYHKFNAGGANIGASLAGLMEDTSRDMNDIVPMFGYFDFTADVFKGIKDWFKSDEAYSKAKSNMYEGEDFVSLAKKGKYLDAANEMFLTATESLPVSITAMMSMAAGQPGVGFELMFANSYQNKADELKGNQDMSQLSKTINAAMTGLSAAATEYLGSIPFVKWADGFVAKYGSDQLKNIVKGSLKDTSGQFFQKYGIALQPVIEGTEEFADQIANNFTNYITGETDKLDLMEGTGKSFAYGMAGGMQFSAGMAAAEGVQKYKINKGFKEADKKFTEFLSANGYAPEEVTQIKNDLLSSEKKDAFMQLNSLVGTSYEGLDNSAFKDYLMDLGAKYISYGQVVNKDNQDIKDLIEQKKQQATEYLSGQVNQTTGTIMTGQIGPDEFQITKGNIVTKEDGTIDYDNSDKQFYYIDDNGVVQVESTNLMNTVNSIPYEEAVQMATDKATAPVIAQKENESVRPYNPGEQVRVKAGNGFLFGTIVSNDNGVYMFKDKQTGQEIQIEPRLIVDEDNLKGLKNGMEVQYTIDGETKTGTINDMNSQRHNGRIEIDNEFIPVENILSAEKPENATTAPTSTDNVQQTQPEGQQNVNKVPEYPVTKDGSIDFEKMTDEQTFQYIRETEGEESANREISNEVTRVQKQISENIRSVNEHTDKTNKMLSNSKSIQESMSIRQKQSAAKISLDEQRVQLDERLNKLKSMLPQEVKQAPEVLPAKGTKTRPEIAALQAKEQPIQEVNSQNTEITTPPAEAIAPVIEETTPPEAKKLSTPQQRDQEWGDVNSMNELILRSIIGGQKIRWSNIESNTGSVISKGLGAEYRFAPAEMKQRIGLIAKDAPTPEQLAHTIWEQYASENGGTFNMDTQEILAEILDIYNTHKSTASMILAVEEMKFTPDENAYYQQEIEEYEKQRLLENIPDEVYASILGLTNFTPEQITLLNTILDSWGEQISNYANTTTESGSAGTSSQELQNSQDQGSEENRRKAEVIRNFESKYAIQPAVIANNNQELYDAIKENGALEVHLKAIEKAQRKSLKGVFYNNIVFINVEEHTTDQDVLNTLIHENAHAANSQMNISAEEIGKDLIDTILSSDYDHLTDRGRADEAIVSIFDAMLKKNTLDEIIQGKSTVSIPDTILPYINNIIDYYGRQSNNQSNNRASRGTTDANENRNNQEGTQRIQPVNEELSGGNYTQQEAGSTQSGGGSTQVTTTYKNGDVVYYKGNQFTISAVYTSQSDLYDITDENGNEIEEVSGAELSNIDKSIQDQNPNTNPSEAQKEAGNYKKAHITVQGMDITVENPKGSTRSGVDEDGQAWSHEMNSHYGYFKRTNGKDGDHIDVFVGPDEASTTVYVVDQVKPKNGQFDESKVMIGYNSPEQAKQAYMENYDDNWQGFSAITPVSVEDFKKWLYDGARQSKPFSEYVGTPEPVEVENSEIEIVKNILTNTKGESFPEQIHTIEDFRNEFNSPVTTPVNKIEVKDNVFNKIIINKRIHISGAIRPTLENPDFILQDIDDSILFVKVFNNEGKRSYNVVAVNKNDVFDEYLASIHIKSTSNILNKMRSGAKLLQPVSGFGDEGNPRNNLTPLPDDKVIDNNTDNQTNNVKSSDNKEEKHLVSEQRYAELKERMRRKLGNLNSGFDPELIAISTEIAVYHIERGAVKFTDFARKLIDELGQAVKPMLKSMYSSARYYPGYDSSNMDNDDFVSKFDLESINEVSNDDTQGSPVMEDAISKINRELTASEASSLATKLSSLTQNRFRDTSTKDGVKITTDSYVTNDGAHRIIWTEPTSKGNVERTLKYEFEPAKTENTEEVKTQATLFEQKQEPKSNENISLRDVHKNYLKLKLNGELTVEHLKDAYVKFTESKTALTEELNKKTKAELIGMLGMYSAYQYKNEKKEVIVKAVLRDMEDDFYLSDTMTVSWGETSSDVIKRAVEGYTQQDVDNYFELIQKERIERAKAKEQKEKALTNPETLEEFRLFVKAKGYEALDNEQRAKYDLLETDNVKEKKAKTETTLVKTDGMFSQGQFNNTKTGEPMFVVTLNNRVSSEEYQAINKVAKNFGGYYSSFNKSGAIPGFLFKSQENSDKFLSDLNSQNEDIQQEQEPEISVIENTTASKLREAGQKIIDSAETEINKDRLTNTAKRAREAGYAETKAIEQKRIGQTMINIADAIENGDVKLLDGIKSKTHIDLLDSLLRTARYAEMKSKNLSYSERQQYENQPITVDTVEFLENGLYPEIYADALRDVINKVSIKNGTKQLAAKWEKRIDKMGQYDKISISSDTQMNEIIELYNALSENEKKYIRISEIIANYKRLRAMGIDNDSMLRVALREYVTYRSIKQEKNKAKELERAIVGRNVGIDFFPTPESTAQRMVDMAEMEVGMSVLEPSAGNGNIAEKIKQSGINPDVVEISSELSKILEAKGFNVVADDFMQFNDKKYDRIIMNPPFSNGMDGEHLQHAFELLNPGGKIIAIVGEGTFIRSDKKATAFREWLDEVGGSNDKLPEGTFNDRKLLNTTGANARIVVIDKPIETKSITQEESQDDPEIFTMQYPVEKIDDYGEKIGGAKKDLGIKKQKRPEWENLPGWRRKYDFANPEGMITLGSKTDTSKPFVVYYTEKVKSWGRTTDEMKFINKNGSPIIFNSEEEAENTIPVFEVVKQGYRIRQDKERKQFYIYKISSTNKEMRFNEFPTIEEATAYMTSTEGATSLLNRKAESYSIPDLEKAERTGPDYRNGADITPKDLTDTFGFRGVEFGNWVKNEERQDFLNKAYDSFMDLSKLLDLSPKALSLNGNLSLSFGSRGVGESKALFDYDYTAINLNRMNGVGSLAHEFGHALDNYFHQQDIKQDYSRDENGKVKATSGAKLNPFRSDVTSFGTSGMRKELNEIFDKISKAMTKKEIMRDIDVESRKKVLESSLKALSEEAEVFFKLFENGISRTAYNRKLNKYDTIILKSTPEIIEKARIIIDKIKSGELTVDKFEWNPTEEFKQLSELYKEAYKKQGYTTDYGVVKSGVMYDLYVRMRRYIGHKKAFESSQNNEKEKAIVVSEFYNTSKEFDKTRAMPYWSTGHELFARAFESYVLDKMNEIGLRNDYLNYDKRPVYDMIYGTNPYPAKEERELINKNFQELFDTVEEKEENAALFRVIGEIGVSRKSVAEKVLDNLALAKQMEYYGYTTKNIRQATGWEKGVDEKWRYEQPDNIKLKNMNADMLTQLIGEDHELFVEYPELKEVQIAALSAEEEESEGIYFHSQYDEKPTIFAVSNSKKGLKSVLIHEIQHAIQDIEGFATGANANVDLDVFTSEVSDVLIRGINEKTSNPIWKLTELDAIIATFYDVDQAVKDEAIKIAKSDKKNIKRYIDDSPYGKYRRTAGEVEARNVQKRMNMTDQERKNTLIAETEDVERQQQIVLFDAVQSAYNEDNSSKNNLDDINKNTNLATNSNNNGSTDKTGLDNRRTVGSESKYLSLGAAKKRDGLYKTVQASNSAGSIRPNYSIEELEDLETRGIDPYFDKNIFFKAVIDNAQANGVLLDQSYLSDKTQIHDKIRNNTSENDVYINPDGKTVTKINDLSYVKGVHPLNNFEAFIDRVYAHNTIFPNVAYTFKGFILNKNGSPSIVLEQPFIQSDRNATWDEITNELPKMGYEMGSARLWSNGHGVWSNGKFELFDARPANVLVGKDGILYFIDTFTHSVDYFKEEQPLLRVEDKPNKHDFVSRNGFTGRIAIDPNIEEVKNKAQEKYPNTEITVKPKLWMSGQEVEYEIYVDGNKVAQTTQSIDYLYLIPVVDKMNPFSRIDFLHLTDENGEFISDTYEGVLNVYNKIGADKNGKLQKQNNGYDRNGDPIIVENEPLFRVTDTREIIEPEDYTEKIRNEVDDKIQNIWSKFLEGHVNEIRPVEVLFRRLRANGVVISENDDYVMKYTLKPGIDDEQITQFRNNFFKPLLKTFHEIEKAGYSYEDIKAYAILKHGPEYDEHIRNKEVEVWKAVRGIDESNIEEYQEQIDEFINSLREDYSGRKVVEKRIGKSGDEFIQEFETKIGEAKVKKLWSQIKAATNYSLEKSHDAGIISTDTYENVSSMFEYYIPLRGHREETAEKKYEYQYENGEWFSKPLQTAKGRKSESEDPFAYVFSMALSSIVQANNNILKQNLLRLAHKDTKGTMSANRQWIKLIKDAEGNVIGKQIAEEPEFNEDVKIYRENIEKFENEMLKLKEKGEAYQSGDKRLNIGGLFIKPQNEKQHEVTVYRNGQLYTIRFHTNPAVPRAINGTNQARYDGTTWGAILNGVGGVTRFMSATKTMFRPTFVIFTNPARDIHQAVNMSFVDEGAKFTANVLKHFPMAVWSIVKYNTNKLDTTNKYDKYMLDYMMNGGKTGITEILEIQNIKNKVERDIKRLGMKHPVYLPGKGADAFVDLWKKLSFITENQMRLAVYMAAKEKGYSDVKSARMAKDATIDFNKKGSGQYGNKELKALFAFINVGYQAINNFYSKVKANPARGTAVIMAHIATGMFLLGNFNSMMSLLFDGDDDSWLEEYANLSEYTRNSSFPFYLGREIGFITIPLSQELRVPFSFGSNFMMFMKGKITAAEMAASTLKGVTALLPYNPIESIANGTPAGAMPDIISPALEITTNKNFMGYQIYNGWKSERKPGFVDIKTNRVGEPYAPEILIKWMEGMNSATGGDNVKKGFVSPDPDKVDHLMNGYLGGLYKMFISTADMVAKEDKSVSEFLIPKAAFIRSKEINNRNTGLNEDYFKVKESIEDMEYLIKGYQNEVEENRMSMDEFNFKVKGLLPNENQIAVYALIKAIEKAEKSMKDEKDKEKQQTMNKKIIEAKKRVIDLSK